MQTYKIIVIGQNAVNYSKFR